MNNAGIAAFTEIEWCPIAEYRRVYEVNSLGPIRVTKTFLPLLRKSSGRIVLVASLAGETGLLSGIRLGKFYVLIDRIFLCVSVRISTSIYNSLWLGYTLFFNRFIYALISFTS